MRDPGVAWYHLVCHTLNTWLHGDARGFRDRDHRIHSSGDYKNPPPESEHVGLRVWAKKRAGPPVLLQKALRPLVVNAFRDRLKKEGCLVLIITCSATHLHALVQLPLKLSEARQIAGRCKRNVSGAVRKELSGSIWAAGGGLKRIKDRRHQLATYRYLWAKQEAGTFVWTFRGEGFWVE